MIRAKDSQSAAYLILGTFSVVNDTLHDEVWRKCNRRQKLAIGMELPYADPAMSLPKLAATARVLNFLIWVAATLDTGNADERDMAFKYRQVIKRSHLIRDAGEEI